LNIAGTARTLSLATSCAAATLLACAALVAPAGATPLKRDVKGAQQVSISGTDVYWIKYIDHHTTQTALMRGSFLDHKKIRLATFTFAGGFEPVQLSSGGGYAYVSTVSDGIDNDVNKGASSKIIRVSRTGTRTVVAAGSNPADDEGSVVVEHGTGRMNDCGKQVMLMSVSSNGSAVIQEVTADRDSTACGKKKNVNHNRIYELPLNGVPREIFSYDVALESTITVDDGGWESHGGRSLGPEVYTASVFGDHAIFSFGRAGGIYVRDLVSGALTGPYLGGLTAKAGFAWGTLDPIGRIAMFRGTFKAGRRYDVGNTVSGLYLTPDDLSAFQKVSTRDEIAFCGHHLIKFSKRRATEIDPVTLAPIRTIASDGSATTGLNISCTEDYLYGVRWHGHDKYTYYARTL
jgi:hypothetical protein